MGILCVFCIYDTIGTDVNIVSKKHFCLYRNNFMQVIAFEIYNPLICAYVAKCKKNFPYSNHEKFDVD